jgi:hypothetical protein
MEPCVRGLTAAGTVKADATGRIFPAVKYTYFVGANGPFTETYFQGQDTPGRVEADIQQRVNNLRALGAVQ